VSSKLEVSGDVIRFGIEVEKALCAAIGREWSAAGISVETLIEQLKQKSAPTGETVPKHKFDTLVQHCKRLDAEIAQARAHVNEITLYQQNAVWFWQHDGEDYLQSLSCPIIIQPHHLRELLSRGLVKRTGTAEHLVKSALDTHLGDDSPDPISKQAFANVVALVAAVQNNSKE